MSIRRLLLMVVAAAAIGVAVVFASQPRQQHVGLRLEAAGKMTDPFGGRDVANRGRH
jgi:hypothetical protein